MSLPKRAPASRRIRPASAACKEVEDEEDEHIYHSKGGCRELWIQSLGMPAVLPPTEEEKDVNTAIGAARTLKAMQADDPLYGTKFTVLSEHVTHHIEEEQREMFPPRMIPLQSAPSP